MEIVVGKQGEVRAPPSLLGEVPQAPRGQERIAPLSFSRRWRLLCGTVAAGELEWVNA